MLTMFDVYYTQNKVAIVDSVLVFCFFVVKNVEIIIEEGRKNPFSRIFELLGYCIDATKELYNSDQDKEFKAKCQEIINCAL